MINEIAPHIYYNDWIRHRSPKADDIVLIYKDSQVLVKNNGESGKVALPCVYDVSEYGLNLKYLFMIDETAYYTTLDDAPEKVNKPLYYESMRIYREIDNDEGFPMITGIQLYRWYSTNRFCGKCAEKLEDSKEERALVCPKCGHIIYPVICPAVTVAIIDNNERILLARSAAGAFRKFALIAGYVEIGESFEETVVREVKEEVGLKVKNLKYYKSQPWGISGAQMVGFFVELDGDDKFKLQESELSEAKWFTREELDDNLENISLTFEMIRMFKENKVKDFLNSH